MKDWLQAALAASGASQVELSRHLTERLHRTIDKTAVNKMLSGRRLIRADELIEIARFTGAVLPAEAQGSAPPATTDDDTLLHVIGVAETGVYRPAAAPEPILPASQMMVAAPADPRFPNARQFVLRQRGDGMALADPPIPPGAYVRCVDATDAKRPLRDGQIVVVERAHEAAQDLVERSIRRVRERPDGFAFVAESPTKYPDARPGLGVVLTAYITSIFNVIDTL
jgi:hypothetical protein